MSTIAQKEAAYIDRLNEILGGGQTNLTLTLSQLEDLNKRSVGFKINATIPELVCTVEEVA